MSLSLSALIYGTQSQEQNETDFAATNTSQLSKILRPVKQDAEVERYYNGLANSNSNSNSTEQPPKKRIKYDYENNNEDREFFGASSAPKVKHQPKRINVKKKSVHDSVSGTWIKINDETEEERKERCEKIANKRKRYLRMRRNPRWNFRNEVDVGNAMQCTLQKAMAHDQQGTRRKQRRKKKEEQLDDELGPTSTEQSQEQLGSLLTRAEALEKTTTIYADAKEDPSHPLHYLWLGHTAPKLNDVQYNYITLVKKTKPKLKGGWQHRDSCPDDTRSLAILIESITKYQGEQNGKGLMAKILRNDDEKKKHNVNYLAPLLDLGFAQEDRIKCPPISQYKRKTYLKRRQDKASYDTKHEEAKRIQSILARYLNGYATALPSTPEETMNKLLNLLHTASCSTDRARTIIRQSQGLACNYVLWNELEPTMLELRSKNIISNEDYQTIRRELLSSDSEFFSDPWATTNKLDCVVGGTHRRKLIFTFIERLRLRHLNYESKKCKIEESKIEKSNDSDGSAYSSGDEEADDSSDEEVKSSNAGVSSKKSRKKSCDPWNLKFSETKANTISLDKMQHTEMCEKYSQVVHNSTTSFATIHLTLSFLLSIMSHHSATNKEGTTDALWKIHKEIESFLSTLSLTCWNSNSDNPARYERVLMSAPLAYVTLTRQSFIANIGMVGATKKIKQEAKYASLDDSEDDSVASKLGDNEPKGTNFKVVAAELAACGQLHLRDIKIRVFHQIHLTTGVSIIAKCLHPSSAEILSRPCFTDHCNEDTPFDLIRLALEETDRKGGIQRNSRAISYGSNVVDVDDLFRELEAAAEVFQDILNLAPHNLCAHCWHVAARIASMIVASGIDIGKGARVACPNDYSMEDVSGFGGAMHRSRHIKYNNLRASASRSFRQLLNLQNPSKQMGHRYHWALKSLLEWKQAICLLAMRPHLDMRKFGMIRQLHVAHTIAWANSECSGEALAAIEALSPTGLVSKMSFISLVANMIEKDPNHIKSWLILASALAPLEDATYMSADSIEYWKSRYFSFPVHLIPHTTLKLSLQIKAFKAVKRAIVKSLAGFKGKNVVGNRNQHILCSKLKRDIKLKKNHKDWLWPTSSSDLDEEDHFDLINDSGEMRTFDDELPSRTVPHIDNAAKVDQFLLELEDESAVIASKSIIAYHMYGSNQYTKNAIDFFVLKCFTGLKKCIVNETCNEYKILLWLARMNIDVVGNVDARLAGLRKEENLKSSHLKSSRLRQQLTSLGNEFNFAKL